MPTAQELMKTHTTTISLGDTLADAVDRMDLYLVSVLPVVNDDGSICGTISEHDIADAVSVAQRDGCMAEVSGRRVSSFMSSDIEAILDTAAVDTRVASRCLHACPRIIVVTDDNKVVGTLNRIDVIQAIFEGVLVLD